MDLKTIKRLLRDLAADPGRPGAKAEAQRLRGEAARLKRRERAPEPEPTADDRPTPAVSRPLADPADGLTEQDREAIKTWPPELRARLNRSSLSRKIDRNALEDPGGWGAKNDL